MEALIIQPIEVLEVFPQAVQNESFLTAIQEANASGKMVIVHFESKFGVTTLLSVRAL